MQGVSSRKEIRPLTTHERPSLLRVLGLVFGLAVVVGGMIGSGIFRAPGVIAQGVTDPTVTLAAWVLIGGAAMLTAMPLVEAGASMPVAGGGYAISGRAFGPSAGVLNGWLSWLQLSASNAFISVVFAEAANRLGLVDKNSIWLAAVGLNLVVGAINLLGTRLAGGSQSLASAIKGGAFIALVAVLFFSRHAPPPPGPPASIGPITSIAGVVMAVRVIYQTYAGWDTAILFNEEVRSPDTNVARSTFWGIGAVIVLYAVINLALFHVLSPAQIAGSKIAVADAARVALGPAGDQILTWIGLFSTAAIVNLQTMGAARITFGMARDEILPAGLAWVSRGGTPVWNVVLVTIVASAFAATGSYEKIVTIYAPWSMGAILMICISAIRLRVAEPDLRRPWRMPLFPWIAILACLVQAGLIAVVMIDDPRSAIWSILFAFAPLPLFWLSRALKRNRA
jgi:basic amino acid/polyamine antiporter, APA family